MGRLWQAAGTVNAVLAPGLLERAVEAGLRSLFVGFETLDAGNLLESRKYQNLRRDYAAAIARLHGLGVMINGSFDDEFYRWASILRGASAHEDAISGLRHLLYAAGWKTFVPLWVNRSGFVGGPIPTEDVAHGTTQQILPRTA